MKKADQDIHLTLNFFYRMNSIKSCYTFSDIRSNVLFCGLLLAFIMLVIPMSTTEASPEDKRGAFVGMRGKKDPNFYDLYGYGDYGPSGGQVCEITIHTYCACGKRAGIVWRAVR